MRHLTILLALSFSLSAIGLAQQSAEVPASASAPNPTSTTVPPPAAGENEADPLLDLPPLPKGDVSLVGGIVKDIDRVRNRLTVEAFGGKKMKFSFDERTHIYRDGIETTQLGIHKGDRVYVDTQQVGAAPFARNIRIGTKVQSAFAQGQIESYDSGAGVMVLRDSLSSEPVAFRVTPKTVVGGKASSLAELREGALVDVKFAPGSGREGVAQEITMTARPGETFKFAGSVTFLDMSAGMLALRNQTDGKTYDIHFDPARRNVDNLALSADVNVTAEFDGQNYVAREITVTQAEGRKK